MPDWSRLSTEQTNPASRRIDELATLDMLQIINAEDALVAPAVQATLAAIAQTVDLAHQALDRGGRLFYVGAGTSGRLGILDASECPPTFSTQANMVQGIIAGGQTAVFQAVEGVEDKIDDGANILRDRNLSPPDMVVGIAAAALPLLSLAASSTPVPWVVIRLLSPVAKPLFPPVRGLLSSLLKSVPKLSLDRRA